MVAAQAHTRVRRAAPLPAIEGWQEVADYALDWAMKQAASPDEQTSTDAGDAYRLAEREAEALGTGAEELDLKDPVDDRPRLTDQLVHPLIQERT